MAFLFRCGTASIAFVLLSSTTLSRGLNESESNDVPSAGIAKHNESHVKHNESHALVPNSTARDSHAPTHRLRRAKTSDDLAIYEVEKVDKQGATTAATEPRVGAETPQEDTVVARLWKLKQAAFGQISGQINEALPAQLLMKLQAKSSEDQAPKVLEPAHGTLLVGNVGHCLAWVLLTLLFAYYYQAHKANIMDHLNLHSTLNDKLVLERKEFSYSLFGCFEEPKLCLFSCCCGAVRWADTMHMLGFFPLMLAVCVFLGAQSLGFLVPGGSILMVIVLTYYRQELRAKFGMTNGTLATCVEDCCTYWWCCVCAITQEARQVELAATVGHPAIVKDA